MLLELLPLAAALAVLSVLAAASRSRRLDRHVTRIGYALFGGTTIAEDSRRERMLRAAGIGDPYRVYVTKTHLYTSAAAFCGSVVGVYGGAVVADALDLRTFETPVGAGLLRPLPDVLKTYSVKLFAVLVVTSVLFGLLAAAAAYSARWHLPLIRADARRRQIDASMPRMVAFIYALSRGGMAVPDVMRALARNRGVFGAGADEMGVTVRSVELFGADLVSAVRDMARRTPSEQFQTFGENLSSVLQSGRDLSGFLHAEYERYRQDAREQQAEILELLATTAEIYVTVVVAGMLFLVTILLVIGLTAGDTLGLIRLIAYVVLPATNVLFVAYLAEITQPLRATRDRRPTPDPDATADAFTVGRHRRHGQHGQNGQMAATDGGSKVGGDGDRSGDDGNRGGDDGGVGGGHGQMSVAGTDLRGIDAQSRANIDAQSRANRDRLRAYERVERLRATVTSPVEALIAEPGLVLYVTVPLAVAFVLFQLPAVVGDGGVRIRVLDDVLVQAVLFVMATFAVAYELSQRRLARLEASVPDLLERLASLNEAGVSVVSSFERVRRSDVGALDVEVERIWRDVQWGATLEEALERFEGRVRTSAVTRVVTLITNAMRASNEIGPVLRIAAEQARSARRLERQRRQEMFTYLVVIYVAFVVFLIVIVAIDFVLVPNLPRSDPSTAVGVPGVLDVGGADVDAYQVTFFHAALVQAALSGLVGGQMGGGSVRDGVKHATVMLAVTYVIFVAVPVPDPGASVAAVVFPLLP